MGIPPSPRRAKSSSILSAKESGTDGNMSGADNEMIDGEKSNAIVAGQKHGRDDEIMDLTSLPDSSPARPTQRPSKSDTIKKRKSTGDSDKENANEVGGSSKKVKKDQVKEHKIAELKKKKLILHQDHFTLDKYTPYITLIAQFHDHLYSLPSESTLDVIPDMFVPLVVMIGHESSAKSLKDLAKHIKTTMKPAEGMQMDGAEEESLAAIPLKTFTTLIPTLFTQESYGFIPTDFSSLLPSASSSTSPAAEIKIPPGLQISRWEAIDIELIPQSEGGRGLKARDVLKQRKFIREQARTECRRIAAELPAETALALLGLSSGEETGRGRQSRVDEDDDVVMVGSSNRGGASASRSRSPEKNAKKAKEETNEQRQKRLAREAKQQQKLEDQARKNEEKAKKDEEKAKKDEEKAKKDEAKAKKENTVAKSAALMSNFFKIAPSTPASTAKTSVPPRDRSQSRESREPSVTISDFNVTFRPYERSKNVELAPMNGFRTGRSSVSPCTAVDPTSWSEKDFLLDAIRTASRGGPLSRPLRSTIGSTSLKTPALHSTVSQIVAKAQEVGDPREVYDHLRDLKKFPRKTLKFAEDLRPPYVGTWSRPSTIVGPRTPFGMDPVIDYSIDEGLDWEEEPAEENIDAMEEDEQSADEDDEESLLGDWLVGDDEVEFVEDGSASPSKKSPGGNDMALLDKQARARDAHESAVAKRKIEKLVPFTKGPIWETRYAEIPWKGFEAYQICFINDTPETIDPFRWQPTQLNPLASDDDAPSTNANPIKEKKAVSATKPKGSFPQSHLASFIRSINGSTKGATLLTQELYVEYKGVATQAVIKMKFDEIAVRAGARSGVWGIVDSAWEEAGLPKPSAPPSALPSLFANKTNGIEA